MEDDALPTWSNWKVAKPQNLDIHHCVVMGTDELWENVDCYVKDAYSHKVICGYQKGEGHDLHGLFIDAKWNINSMQEHLSVHQ